MFLIINDDADDQSVISFYIDLLTFKVERLNFTDDADDAVECVQVKLVFNNESQVFLNESFLHKRKSLIAVLASENKNRSSFDEEVIEVYDVQCRLSLLLESKKKIKILDKLMSEVKRI